MIAGVDQHNSSKEILKEKENIQIYVGHPQSIIDQLQIKEECKFPEKSINVCPN